MATVRAYTADHEGTGKMLVGPEMRSLVQEAGEVGAALYRERVKKDTGENARLVRVHTEIAGKKNDRWTSVITAYAQHAAAREFGNRGRPGEHVLRTLADDLEAGIE
ncbi:hypothetical protein [Rhodococcus erythropolis]|uniref:hypothetical protein n=1 Tax=Rhodococcus erythropolis TaxID=1833 RepID=UPI000878CF38|nr:hypothetical protein [Rhodococcus erythropolis]OFV79246.1 hypothetical protein RERY_02520 [Rhodococcus erythropolis]